MASISVPILLILLFSLYFILLYLQIFSVFFDEYLWGFATVPHPMLHPFISIIKQSLSGGNLVTKFFRVFTNLISSWLK